MHWEDKDSLCELNCNVKNVLSVAFNPQTFEFHSSRELKNEPEWALKTFNIPKAG